MFKKKVQIVKDGKFKNRTGFLKSVAGNGWGFVDFGKNAFPKCVGMHISNLERI